MRGSNIVVGVSGGIAAYKACELVRLLKKAGAHVAVTMTRSATRLVQPLTFQILSENPVFTSLWRQPHLEVDFEPREGLPAGPVPHVDLGAFADLIVVAPATGNILAKAAHGLADDALSTVLLAARNPVLFAPSMNVNMWNAEATQENLRTLHRRGAHFVDPGTGLLACGWEGKGRLAEPEEIFAAVKDLLARGASARSALAADGQEPGARLGGAQPGGALPGSGILSGRTVLVSAGPTEEPIDAVRFLSNRSSGKMGYAVAEVARELGAKVILVSGPTALDAPAGVERVAVRTAEEMRAAVLSRSEGADIVVMAAAVADYRVAEPSAGKLKRTGPRTVELLPNPDILAELGSDKRGRFLVGFALEVESCMANASKKLETKQADLIVLNNPMDAGSAFGGDTNKITLLEPGRASRALPLMTKLEAARAILEVVAERVGVRA